MTVTSVRALVQAGLHELGLVNAVSLGERYLIRSGGFAGILFEFEEVSAIYLVNADHLKFVNNSGEVLKLLPIEHSQDVAVKAA